MSLVIFWIWLGGVRPAYVKGRAAGYGRIFAAGECLWWPAGLGRYLVRRFYEPDQP